MFSENDMQDLLDHVREWITAAPSNGDMITRAYLVKGALAEYDQRLLIAESKWCSTCDRPQADSLALKTAGLTNMKSPAGATYGLKY